MQSKLVEVRSSVKRNAITLTFVGLVGIILGLVLFLSSSVLFAPALCAFALGIIATVLGVSKQMEPEVSITLSPDGLSYHHRRGSLFIEWENVQRFDIPKSLDGLETIELPFIGIRLKKINPVLDVIPGRLATGLLTEQRPLLMSAVTLDENLEVLEDYLNSEFTPLLVNGERYRGVLAMYGHRSEMLNRNLGYHQYIPFDCLDREPREFLTLLRDYLQEVRESA
ncbi:DUF2982 domain-containing protein [Shewanella woodyi]|uniref:DUF2982 domain-containing protein n=1 Tax=Shewanella woodyi (strain ATCC 51908 / MS32) TaxID=392500 RepID=B1KMJ7_SHEWM|nr:DUF2982 domain-containing protein [Shewanella woodyi]ACA85995.1 conserved hypothetical protein [Shewanella woodyi ATCC 51908]